MKSIIEKYRRIYMKIKDELKADGFIKDDPVALMEKVMERFVAELPGESEGNIIQQSDKTFLNSTQTWEDIASYLWEFKIPYLTISKNIKWESMFIHCSCFYGAYKPEINMYCTNT